jgi:hypothetical protein
VSRALKTMLNATALEHQRVLSCAAQIAALTPISELGVLEVVSANTLCRVDCVNRIIDPEGAGGLTNWFATDGSIARVAGGTPPGWNTLNPGYVAYTSAAGTGAFGATTDGADATVDSFAAGTTFWVCLFAYGPAPATLQVLGAGSMELYAQTPLDAGGGWGMYELSGVCTVQEGLTVQLVPTGDDLAQVFGMTGMTLVVEKDPGGPFSGDTQPAAFEQAFAYAWEGDQTYSATGVRNHSRSDRFGTQYDLVALAEAQSGLSLAPLGLTEAQRQLFLQQRFSSRGIPWSSKLIQLIVELIQTENSSFTTSEVVIEVDAANRSYSVSINYSPDGALYQRLLTLIEGEVPAHLARQQLISGAFQAGISVAGDPV